MTSGASIITDSACLPQNRPRSIRKALVVPIATDSAVTAQATSKLVQMLASSSSSPNRPVRPLASLPKNQSSVKPCQGGAGYAASLNANTATVASGRNRNTRNASRYSAVPARSQAGRGSDGIMCAASRRRSAGR